MFAARSLFFFPVVALTAIGLSGCAGVGGTTYGTGESQEAALVKDVTSLLGPKEKKAPIDYSARPGLVLPPEGAPLANPASGKAIASNAAANWPDDPDELRRIYKQRLETMNDDERAALLEAIRRLPKAQRDAITKNDPRSVAFANEIEDLDYSNGPPDPNDIKRYEAQVKERKARILAAQGKTKGKRTYLTQPPENFRDLSPEVRQEIARAGTVEKKEEGNFFKKIWPF